MVTLRNFGLVMKLGNKINLYFILFLISFNFCLAEEKISSTPLINIDEINITLDNINKKNVFDYDKELKKKEILFKKIENDN